MRQEFDRLFRALGDPTRRSVVELLRDGPRRAGDLATVAQVSPPVMSRHLRILLNAGLVDDERSPTDARVRLFFLRKESLATLQAWLAGERP
jgi:DNA-binding transcriptional ArsR family regulator